MITRYEKIRQLYIERLSGAFTAEDEINYQELLKSDPYARGVVETLEKESNHLNIDLLKQADEEEALQEIKRQLKTNQRFLLVKRGLVAATIIFIVSLGVVWYPKQQPVLTKEEQPISNVTESPGVKLKLANGESVELLNDNAGDTIAVGGVNIVTKGNTLESTGGNVSSAMNLLSVPAKEDYKIVLSDGTKVWLNSETILKFPFRFTGTTREVTLEGEAYFEVAHDAKHTFVVHTKGNTINVLGTRFNVNTYSANSVTTSLLEGKVRLAARNNEAVNLKPGVEAQFNEEKGFVLKPFNQENVLSWQKGVYYLENTSLKDVRVLISRWFDIDVIFDKAELQEYQITGLLEKEHLSDFLKDLETSAQIQYYYSGKELHIK